MLRLTTAQVTMASVNNLGAAAGLVWSEDDRRSFLPGPTRHAIYNHAMYLRRVKSEGDFFTPVSYGPDSIHTNPPSAPQVVDAQRTELVEHYNDDVTAMTTYDDVAPTSDWPTLEDAVTVATSEDSDEEDTISSISSTRIEEMMEALRQRAAIRAADRILDNDDLLGIRNPLVNPTATRFMLMWCVHHLEPLAITNPTYLLEENCPICHESFDLKDPQHTPMLIKGVNGCNSHIFGNKCILEWITSGLENANTCPICRSTLMLVDNNSANNETHIALGIDIRRPLEAFRTTLREEIDRAHGQPNAPVVEANWMPSQSRPPQAKTFRQIAVNVALNCCFYGIAMGDTYLLDLASVHLSGFWKSFVWSMFSYFKANLVLWLLGR